MRHDLSRNLLRIRVENYHAGGLDEDVVAADLLQGYEARIEVSEDMIYIATGGLIIRRIGHQELSRGLSALDLRIRGERIVGCDWSASPVSGVSNDVDVRNAQVSR